MSDQPHFEHPQHQGMGQVSDPNAGLQAQIQALTLQVQALQTKRVNFNTDLIGLIETVTAAPTLTPSSPYQQIKIAEISGTSYIYFYDTSSKTWKKATIA